MCASCTGQSTWKVTAWAPKNTSWMKSCRACLLHANTSTSWGTSVTPSTPSWWCSSGVFSLPDPRWPETSGTSWWASASNFSPTSEPPPPWDNDPGSRWRTVGWRNEKKKNTGCGCLRGAWAQSPWYHAVRLWPPVFSPILEDLMEPLNPATHHEHRQSYQPSLESLQSKCCIFWIFLTWSLAFPKIQRDTDLSHDIQRSD